MRPCNAFSFGADVPGVIAGVETIGLVAALRRSGK